MTDNTFLPILEIWLESWETPIKWPNSLFQRGEGEEYIRVKVTPASSRFAGVGTLRQAVAGVILISVFVPLLTDSKRAGELAEKLITLFVGKQEQGLSCTTAYATPGPEQHSYYQLNVNIKFQYNQCYK